MSEAPAPENIYLRKQREWTIRTSPRRALAWLIAMLIMGALHTSLFLAVYVVVRERDFFSFLSGGTVILQLTSTACLWWFWQQWRRVLVEFDEAVNETLNATSNLGGTEELEKALDSALLDKAALRAAGMVIAFLAFATALYVGLILARILSP